MRFKFMTLLCLLSLAAPVTVQGQRTEREKREAQKEREKQRLEREKDEADEEDMEHEYDDDEDMDEGGDESDDPGQGRSSIDTTVAFSRTGVADLSLISGQIIVRAWTRNEAKVSATSERGLIESDFSSSRIALKLRTKHGRSGVTRFEVTLPVGARVIANSVSGDITSTGTRGEVEAHSVSGDVTVNDASGRVSLQSVSGTIMGETLSGDVRAEAVSGDVELLKVDGEVSVETVSGGIRLPDVRSKFVRTESVSGDVEYRGPFDGSGRYEFHSHSGTLRITIPNEVSARVSVETFSGSIESDFPITIQPGRSGRGRSSRHMEFTLGSGTPNARIIAETFSGDIFIEKGGARP